MAIANVRGAMARGLRVGVYHFQEDADPSAEIAHFLVVAKAALPAGHEYHLRPALDVESSQFSHPLGAHVAAAVAELHRRLDYFPVIYGNPSDLGGLVISDGIARCPLWLADYGLNDGREHSVSRVPNPWKRIAAHQFTSVGSCPGIAGHVDVSSVARGGDLDVPRPRMIIDKYKIGYMPRHGARRHVWSRSPALWLVAHKGAKKRGKVAIYPHRREA